MRRTLPYAALALVAVVATPIVLAQGGSAPGALDKSRVAAGTYAADAGHTMVVWEVDHLGFSKYTGIFGDVTAHARHRSREPRRSQGRRDDPGVEGHDRQRRAHRPPAARGQGRRRSPTSSAPPPPTPNSSRPRVVLDDDGDEAKVTGNLTLNGVTRPVTLDVDFHGAGVGMNKKETIGFQAETTIKRSDFGINMGIPCVSDAVELEIHAAFEKQ